jgi:hypothetical protein
MQPFYRKELATGNTTSGNYKLLTIALQGSNALALVAEGISLIS